ncbi:MULTISPECIES: ABC transporter permease [unclassified Fusibacter]|uniref:ABC transporter permease n=1 Tax=unclassified Fusibacter TaxID=2624464 RepID=UPI0013E99244|nr:MULTISPECIES: ABC transporter permease [unclassified Fusibacter]MCK8058504.1 ABC transporter permease [Fusibacter sp. A2]NPE22727.1 FtsX-like permease family protein [Fusibacter sp. A1]
MRTFELIRIAVSSIWTNKMRSLLTMLGLIIGISAVVTIFSIGDGSQSAIEGELGGLGVNNISIYEQKNVQLAPDEKLTLSDIDKISESFSDLVLAIAPVTAGQGVIVDNLDDTSVSMTGANSSTKIIDDLTMIEGRFLNDRDIAAMRQSIVIDSDLSDTLFGEASPIGQRVPISNGRKTTQYYVIGVYEKTVNAFGFQNYTVYLPYSTLDKVYNKKGVITSITMTMANKETLKEDAQRIVDFLHNLHRIKDQDAYMYFSLDSMIETVSDALGQITLLVSAIAGISLVVGGIGVMNIMLVSVTERTREIGIRKALGARRIDILVQFLIEAVLICLIGGAFGVLFGYLFTKTAENLMKTPMNLSLFSILLAVIFSSSIGIVFGVYPANKASKLDPIEALRYE